MAASIQAARNTITGVLRSSILGYIDFTFNKWRINAAGFARVAHAVDVGNIPVKIGPVTPGAGAMYDFGSDTLTFPPDPHFGTTVYAKAKILHECTHAFIDMEARNHSFDSANEGAAYIAELMYMLYSLNSVPDPFAEVAPDQKKVVEEGGFAMVGIKLATALVNNGGGVVSLEDEMKLRVAIAANSHYRRYQHMTLYSLVRANGLRLNNP